MITCIALRVRLEIINTTKSHKPNSESQVRAAVKKSLLYGHTGEVNKAYCRMYNVTLLINYHLRPPGLQGIYLAEDRNHGSESQFS